MPNHRFTLIKLMLVGLVASVLTGCASSRMMPPNFQIIPAEELSDKALEELSGEIAIHTEESYDHVEAWSERAPAGVKIDVDKGGYHGYAISDAFKEAYTIKGEVILDFETPRKGKWATNTFGLWRFESAAVRGWCVPVALSKLILIGFVFSDLCSATEPSHAYAMRRLKAATSYLKGNSFVITDYRTENITETISTSNRVIVRDIVALSKVRALILHDPFFEKARQARVNTDETTDASASRGE